MTAAPMGGTAGREEAFVAGADGGGTRLRFALADGAGRVVSRGEGPSGLVGAGRDGKVARALVEGVRAMAAEAGADLPLEAFCAGLAGTGDAAGVRAVEGEVRAAGVARRVQVVPDALIALEDAFPRGEAGILLIAGTGSIALGRDRAGKLHRCGGYGALLADEGSGYRLGLEGLRAGARGSDGRGPATRLSELLPAALGVAGGGELWPHRAAVVLREAPKGEIAALAPLVARAAGEGDRVAAALLEVGVAELLAHVEALTTRIGERLSVAPWGGLIGEGGALGQPLRRGLQGAGYALREGDFDAVRGALELARRG